MPALPGEMMIRLTFYTTSGCHLCEQAMVIIREVNEANSWLSPLIQIERIDIAESDDLIQSYGPIIPVLEACLDKKWGTDYCRLASLRWPFDHQDYVNLINQAIQQSEHVN